MLQISSLYVDPLDFCGCSMLALLSLPLPCHGNPVFQVSFVQLRVKPMANREGEYNYLRRWILISLWWCIYFFNHTMLNIFIAPPEFSPCLARNIIINHSKPISRFFVRSELIFREANNIFSRRNNLIPWVTRIKKCLNCFGMQ